MRNKRNRKQAQEEPQVKRGTLTAALDLPEDVLKGYSQISLSGNREAVVEGCAGILEYDDTLVKLSLNKMMVQFTGRSLQIKCMTGESLIVEGFITGMEFLC